MHFTRIYWVLVILCLLIPYAVISKPPTLNLIGEGATFPLDIYTGWMSYYASSRFGYVDLRQKYNARGSESGLLAMVETLSYGTINQSPFLNKDSLPGIGTSELPYTDKEFQNYTDLVMFPVLAGSLVLAYNMPEIKSLILTLDQLVGIFNGTLKFWNETTFSEINDQTFPNVSIKPVARYFTSGSTYLFTKSLSAHSATWRNSYGSFATKNGWPKSANFEYGQKSAGMIDTIFSLPYSIGYVPLWLAESSNIKYARLINNYGDEVSPKSIKSLQNAAEANRLKLLASKHFTSDLIDASKSNYPIIGYSYMIVKLKSIVSCKEAIELARFIKWISTSSDANSLANSFYMVNMAGSFDEEIDFRVLKRMTCDMKLVQDLVIEQMSVEEETRKTWKTPLGVSIPICLIIAAGIVVGVKRQRKKYMEMMDKNEWNINALQIEFDLEKRMTAAKHRRNRIKDSVDGSKPVTHQPEQIESKYKCSSKNVSSIRHLTGKYNEVRMCFSPMWLEGYFDTNMKVRLTLTRMRSSLDHTNLLRFYGLTWMNDKLYIAEEFGEKGLLIDVLRHLKFELSDDFRFAIARDIASGLSYLHRKEVVHGFLNTDSCVVDSRWTVKVRGWEYNLINQTNKVAGRAKTNLNIYEIRRQQLNESEQKEFDFWIPPEVEMAKGKDFYPTKACDSFSFGLVLFKIFTTTPLRVAMRQPILYKIASSSDKKDVEDNKTQVLINRLKKYEGVQALPNKVKVIIGQACAEEPSQRVSFDRLSVMLKAAHNSKYMSTTDNIIESLEHYGNEIETKLDDLGKRLRKSLEDKDKLISKKIPSWAMNEIRIGKEINCGFSANVTVAALDIDIILLESIIKLSSTKEKTHENHIFACLECFDTAIEELVDDNSSWLFKAEHTSTGVSLIAGLEDLPFAQNIFKMIELIWGWIKQLKMRCLRTILEQDFLNQNLSSIHLFLFTLHGGPASFGLRKSSTDLADLKFYSYGEAVMTARKLNAFRPLGTTGTNNDRILGTGIIVNNFPTSLVNVTITPTETFCGVFQGIPLYWIELDRENDCQKIPDVY